MAMPAGSTGVPTGSQTLPSPKQVVAHTRAQNGVMTKGRPTPARRRALAVAAAASGGAGKGAPAPAPNPYVAQAQAQIDPIIAAITASATGQAQAADQAIQGLTDSYAKGIGSIDYGSPYSGAEAQQAAVDAALQQSATGQGSDLAAALAQRLQALQGSSGANAVNQEAAALASQGSGIGGAQLASGSAALNQLISDAAAAKSYGQKMPGVIDSAGLQGIEQSQGQAQQAINQGTLQAESQLPQIEQNLKADALQAKADKATQAYKNAEIALRGQSNKISAFRATTAAQQGAARIAQGAQRIQIEAQRAAQTALNSNRSYGLSLQRLGLENKRLQMQAMTSEIKLKNGGLTPAEVSRYKAMSYGLAHEGFSTTYTDKATGQEAHYTYQQVLQQMTEKGIPPSMAMKALNAAGFKPGVRGAPRGLSPAAGNGKGMFTNLGGMMRPFSVAGSAVETAAGHTIVGLAQQYAAEKVPYVWGGSTPKGFDCSGFAQYLYGKAGISIPRTTYTQRDAGTPVGKGALLPGDLVFFKGSDSVGGKPGHVGIYIGGGRMIDEPHTGSYARVESVAGFPGYMGARRFGKG